MAMPGEFEFYSTRSGLPATASLMQHQLAYWRSQVPAIPAAAAYDEAEFEFYLAKLAAPRAGATLSTLRHLYFDSVSPLAVGTVADLMAAFFLDPPPVFTLLLTSTPTMPPPVPLSSDVLYQVVASADPGGVVELGYTIVSGDPGEGWKPMALTGALTYQLTLAADEAPDSYFMLARSGAVLSNEIAFATA